jgi:hypothetical protein
VGALTDSISFSARTSWNVAVVCTILTLMRCDLSMLFIESYMYTSLQLNTLKESRLFPF